MSSARFDYQFLCCWIYKFKCYSKFNWEYYYNTMFSIKWTKPFYNHCQSPHELAKNCYLVTHQIEKCLNPHHKSFHDVSCIVLSINSFVLILFFETAGCKKFPKIFFFLNTYVVTITLYSSYLLWMLYLICLRSSWEPRI